MQCWGVSKRGEGYGLRVCLLVGEGEREIGVLVLNLLRVRGIKGSEKIQY